MTKVAASFVGDKVSQADGEEALAELAAAGLEPVTAWGAADVVVVHTCCVTAEAERKSRRLVRRAAAASASWWRAVRRCCAGQQFEGDGVTVAARPDGLRRPDGWRGTVQPIAPPGRRVSLKGQAPLVMPP